MREHVVQKLVLEVSYLGDHIEIVDEHIDTVSMQRALDNLFGEIGMRGAVTVTELARNAPQWDPDDVIKAMKDMTLEDALWSFISDRPESDEAASKVYRYLEERFAACQG